MISLCRGTKIVLIEHRHLAPLVDLVVVIARFRVRVDGLKPKTTYYYKVDSASAGSGPSDGVVSPLKTFITE